MSSTVMRNINIRRVGTTIVGADDKIAGILVGKVGIVSTPVGIYNKLLKKVRAIIFSQMCSITITKKRKAQLT